MLLESIRQPKHQSTVNFTRVHLSESSKQRWASARSAETISHERQHWVLFLVVVCQVMDWICNWFSIYIFFTKKQWKKMEMEHNPPLKSGNVGCLGNLRWLKAPSTSRVTANILHQPGARLTGDLEDSPMADGERECRRGGRRGGRQRGRVRGTVHLASPACLFPLGDEREILSSLLIYWCLSSQRGKLAPIYLAQIYKELWAPVFQGLSV